MAATPSGDGADVGVDAAVDEYGHDEWLDAALSQAGQ
jgi:hypothetical protein